MISSTDDDNETIVHAEGKLDFNDRFREMTGSDECIPIQELKAQSARAEDGASYYDKFRKYGFDYGPSFQTVQEIFIHPSFALAKLKIGNHLKGDFDQFILHPSIIDGALQTAAALVGGLETPIPHLPFALDEVTPLRPVRQSCYAYAEFADGLEESQAGVRKFNIRLLNESGDVLVNFRNLFLRPLADARIARHVRVAQIR